MSAANKLEYDQRGSKRSPVICWVKVLVVARLLANQDWLRINANAASEVNLRGGVDAYVSRHVFLLGKFAMLFTLFFPRSLAASF